MNTEIKDVRIMKFGSRPQDLIPVERIIYYIIKDYRRMYDSFFKMERERDNAVELAKKANDRREKTSVRVESLKKEVERLNSCIKDVRESRDAVVEAATSDLEERLAEANNRIRLLAQAVVEPGKPDSVFLKSCVVHTMESDDDRKWMDKAMKQLEKAAMALLAVEARMVQCEELLKECQQGESVEKALKNHTKALSKINTVVSHIECFFDKVGDIKLGDE